VNARIAIALCVSATACAHAFRCPERGGPTWVEARSAHFTMQTDSEPEQAIAKLVELERLRAGMALLWQAPHAPFPPIDFFAPRNADEMHEFTDRAPVLVQTASFGDVALVVSAQDDIAGEPIVKSVVSSALDGLWLLERVPWLVTGFTEYLSGVRVDHGEAVFGEPSLLSLKALRDRHGPEPVSWVLDEKRPWAAPDPGTSWLLVHYLMDVRRQELVDLLRRLGRGEPVAPAIASTLGAAIGGDALDDELQAYWKAGRLGTIRLRLPSIDERVTVRTLPEAELHAWRAEFFGLPKKKDEREEARRHDATEPRALVGISDRAEGMAAARAATVARPDDWRSWYLLWWYASRLETDDMDDFYLRKSAPRSAEADEALARAARATTNPIPHAMLADLALIRHDVETGLREAEVAVRSAPTWPLYLDAYAAALAASGRCPEARAAQARAVERADLEGRLAVRHAIRDHLDEYEHRCPGR